MITPPDPDGHGVQNRLGKGTGKTLRKQPEVMLAGSSFDLVQRFDCHVRCNGCNEWIKSKTGGTLVTKSGSDAPSRWIVFTCATCQTKGKGRRSKRLADKRLASKSSADEQEVVLPGT